MSMVPVTPIAQQVVASVVGSAVQAVADAVMADDGPTRKRGRELEFAKKMAKGTYVGGAKLNDLLEIPTSRIPSGPYAKYGSYGQDECYGTLAKADIAALAFCSVKTFGAVGDGQAFNEGSVSGTLSYHVAAALLRYILQREFNYSVERHDQYVVPYRLDTGNSGADHANADPCPQILFYWKKEEQTNVLGDNVAPTYGMGYRLVLSNKNATKSSQVYTFSQLARLVQHHVITHGLFGGVGDASINTNSLYAYQICMPDIAENDVVIPKVAAAYRPLVKLEDMYIKAYSTGELTLQNITVGDSGLEANQYLTNRIDANPLQGTILKFATPFPKIKQPLKDVWSHTADTNVVTYGLDPLNTVESDSAAQLKAWQQCFDRNGDGLVIPKETLTNSWYQLPTSQMFYDCTGESKFGLQPGEIRKCVLKYEFDGKLTKFIRSQQLNAGTVSSHLAHNNTRGCGTSVLISLEKVMSTGSSSNVSLNYQQCYYAGCHVTGVRKPRLQPYNKDTYSTYDNMGSNNAKDNAVV